MTSPSEAPMPSPRRLTSLDGLRGLASLMVVFTHVRLATEALGAPPDLDERMGEFARGGFLLGLISDGSVAVAIFFVLSGVVLTLPFLRSSGWQRWVAYYPRRVLRLYLPVWASIVLALGWYFTVPRRTGDDLPWWVADHAQPLALRPLAQALSLTRSTFLNTPLWSLVWEVAFSLLLPLFVFAVRSRRPALHWLTVGLAFGAIAVGGFLDVGSLIMLPQFLIGAVIAASLDPLRDWLVRLPRWGAGLGIALAVALIWVSWLEWLIDISGFAPEAWSAKVAAAALIVLLFLGFTPAITLADTRVVQWLGRISFSLYLVHEPLIVSLRMLVAPAQPSMWLLALLAIPLSLALGQAFYVIVERPAHRLAQFVGRWVRHRLPATTREGA